MSERGKNWATIAAFLSVVLGGIATQVMDSRKHRQLERGDHSRAVVQRVQDSILTINTERIARWVCQQLTAEEREDRALIDYCTSIGVK